MKVCQQRCDECLFGRTPIVSSDRRRQILNELERDDKHFICHKHSFNGDDVVCRGDYDRNPFRTNLMRIAHRLGVVRFVPFPKEKQHA